MWTDAYLERKLKKAQAVEDRERRKKRGTTDLSSSVLGKVLLYGGYLWAVRLAFVAFGSGLPLLGAFLSLFLPSPRNGLQTLPTAARLPPNNVVFSLRHSSPLLVQNSSLSLESLRDVPYQNVFVQTAQEDVFSSFDETAPWASLLTTPTAWERTRKYRIETFAEGLGSLQGFPFTSNTDGNTCKKEEEGGGEACVYPPPPRKRKNNWLIKQSISSVKVGKLAPELLSTLGAAASSSDADAQQLDFELWLGKENVTLAPQYFTHNSVLLQVQGQSTVLIASPDAFRFYHPGSVLHPGRSQAQRDYLQTPAQIDRAIRGELMRSEYEGEIPPAVAYWHDTLGPGDLLLVPAFYYVTAVLGPDSATILGRPNHALHPPLFLLYAQHKKEDSISSSGPVPLPFDEAGAAVDEKLAALGSAIGSLIANPVVRGKYTVTFVKRAWRDRHRKSAYLTKGRGDGSSLWCDGDEASYGTCTTEARELVQRDKEYQIRALSTVHALTLLLLQTDELSYATPSTEEEVSEGQEFAIRLQMTLDWTEHQLHKILSDKNSNPCAVLRFIETCL